MRTRTLVLSVVALGGVFGLALLGLIVWHVATFPRDSWDGPTASMSGVVYVAEEWKLERAMVELVWQREDADQSESRGYGPHRLDRIDSNRKGFDAFRWSQSDLRAGHYLVSVSPARYDQAVELPPEGRDDVEVVVPPPADLRVFVVDEASGEPIEAVELRWHPACRDSNGGPLETAKFDPDARCCRIRAPACAIVLRLRSDEFDSDDESVDLGAGVREHTIRVHRSCGVVVEVGDGERRLEIPNGWYVQVRPVSGPPVPWSSSGTPFERRYIFNVPGTYVVEPVEFEGYATPPTQTVDVAAGRFTRCRFALERR